MALTLAEIDRRLAACAHGIHSPVELDRDVAWARVDYYLDERLKLTQAPVAPPTEEATP